MFIDTPRLSYFAALNPTSKFGRWLQVQCHKLIAATWLLGAIYAYIPIRHTYTHRFTMEGSVHYQCIVDNSIDTTRLHKFLLVNVLFTIVLPLTIMTFSYGSIMFSLKENAQYIDTPGSGNSGSRKASMKQVCCSKKLTTWMKIASIKQ